MPLVKIDNALISIMIIRECNSSGIYLCEFKHKTGIVSIHRDDIMYNDITRK